MYITSHALAFLSECRLGDRPPQRVEHAPIVLCQSDAVELEVGAHVVGRLGFDDEGVALIEDPAEQDLGRSLAVREGDGLHRLVLDAAAYAEGRKGLDDDALELAELDDLRMPDVGRGSI